MGFQFNRFSNSFYFLFACINLFAWKERTYFTNQFLPFFLLRQGTLNMKDLYKVWNSFCTEQRNQRYKPQWADESIQWNTRKRVLSLRKKRWNLENDLKPFWMIWIIGFKSQSWELWKTCQFTCHFIQLDKQFQLLLFQLQHSSVFSIAEVYFPLLWFPSVLVQTAYYYDSVLWTTQSTGFILFRDKGKKFRVLISSSQLVFATM